MKKLFFVGILLILAVITVYSLNSGSSDSRKSQKVNVAESEIRERWDQEGDSYVVIGGDYYKDSGNGSYSYLQNYYNQDFYKKYYTVEGDAVYVESPDEPSIQVRLRNEFREDFESYASVRDLIVGADTIEGKGVIANGVTRYDPNNLSTRWLTLTLQSPSAPSVAKYNALGKKILEEGADFADNRIDPSTQRVHSGKQSMRFSAVSPGKLADVSKTSISSDTFHFKKGDDFWFSGWFYFEKGMPVTIMDLESTWLEGHSGLRVLFEDGHPYIELKALGKPSWRNSDYTVPQNEWVFFKSHFLLDEKDGKVELWINDKLVVEGRGKTLPLADSVLNSLELGITATYEETVLFVDDVKVSESAL